MDEVAQENAAALVRAVRHLAHLGYDQYADLGCGRPMQGMDALNLPDLADLAEEIQSGCQWLALDCDELDLAKPLVVFLGAVLHFVVPHGRMLSRF
ncbi:hypothetical protein ETD86_18480 [Nonomuraea turkmeniaca]|uniref:Uncharacterized protein n=1 Tax=Nonomuraea turkmeniaca TaxID=103838 RepID=A0A5S4FIJ5_9ACTN|nr:hypothetical protein ETD86_18480 [Nonomuraea turkmeniaca]